MLVCAIYTLALYDPTLKRLIPKRCQIQSREQKSLCRLTIPTRIQARWAKHHNLPQQNCYQYRLDSVLEAANSSANEFRKSWAFLHPRLPSDELFSLFKDSGFSPDDIAGRLAFVRHVLKRYKAEQVFPRL